MSLFSSPLKGVITNITLLSLLLLGFNNCSPQSSTSSTANMSSLDLLNNSSGSVVGPAPNPGNGAGYVGLQVSAPVSVIAGTSFSVRVIGGQGPYVFQVVSGGASILRQNDDIATLRAEREGPIEIAVKDASGATAFAITNVITFGADSLFADQSMLRQNQVLLTQNSELIRGDTSPTYYNWKSMDLSYDTVTFDYQVTSGGSFSVYKLTETPYRHWQLQKRILGKEVASLIQAKIGEETVPYNFGEFYDFDGTTLAAHFHFSYAKDMILNNDTLHRALVLLTWDASASSFRLAQIELRTGGGRMIPRLPVAISKDQIISGEGSILRIHSRDLDSTKTVQFTLPSTLKIIRIRSSGEQLFVGAVSNPPTTSQSGAVFVYAKSGTTWVLKQTLTTQSGGLMNFDVKANHLVMNTLRSGNLSSVDAQKFTQNIEQYSFVSTGWQRQGVTTYQTFTACKDIAVSDTGYVVLGCPENYLGIQSIYYTDSELAAIGATYEDLSGRVYIYHSIENQSQLQRIATLAPQPLLVDESQGTLSGLDLINNRPSFGWSVSTSNDFISVYDYGLQQISVFEMAP